MIHSRFSRLFTARGKIQEADVSLHNVHYSKASEGITDLVLAVRVCVCVCGVWCVGKV